jgi:hypothetical protein
MVRVIEDLAGDWRRLDERIEGLSSEIEVLARRDVGCERLMSLVGAVGAVAHEPPGRHEETVRVDRRQAVPGRERDDEIAVQIGVGIG